MSLKARQRLVLTLLDAALEDLPKKHANFVAELLLSRGVEIVEGKLDVDGDALIMLHPAHPTTRLLSAINAHMIATDEPGETIVDRLIKCLGSSDALDALPN